MNQPDLKTDYMHDDNLAQGPKNEFANAFQEHLPTSSPFPQLYASASSSESSIATPLYLVLVPLSFLL